MRYDKNKGRYVRSFREKCSNFFCNIEDTLFNVCFATVILASCATIGLYIYAVNSSRPKPPVYRDVNGDGIEDKIIQRRVYGDGLKFFPTLEEETLFGIDINGKRVYLPKEQFGELK